MDISHRSPHKIKFTEYMRIKGTPIARWMIVRKIIIIEVKMALKKDENEELRIRGGKIKREFFYLNIQFNLIYIC